MQATSGKNSASAIFRHRLSMFLIALLVAIGGAVIWAQNRFDPGMWRQVSNQHPLSIEASSETPEGLVPLSKGERYDAATLSDKIDGKADLYLNAGFQHLECRRYALASDKRLWMERYIYNMGDHSNAYAVYSAQRRSDVQPSNLTANAYLSANSLFLVHGPYYIEIIGSAASDQLKARMADLGAAFVASRKVASEAISELDLFPKAHQVAHSEKLVADSAFGIQMLDRVFTSNYARDQAEAIAFVSKRASAAEARALADTFVAYWKEYGGQTVQTPAQAEGARIVFILDNYEIAMVQDNYFFGVHEATQLDMALGLVSRLQQAIERVNQ